MSTFVIGPVPIFDPELEALAGDRFIIVKDGTIVDVLDASASVPASATRIAAEGKVAIPGLIDCHVHLCYDGDPARFTAPTEKPGTLAALAMNAMREQMAAGVTTVRDCGAPDGMVIQLRDAVDQGLIFGPRIVAAGRMLTMTGGTAGRSAASSTASTPLPEERGPRSPRAPTSSSSWPPAASFPGRPAGAGHTAARRDRRDRPGRP